VWKKVGKWVSGKNSWPALLLVITGAYWLSPRVWWSTITFVFIGILYLALVVAHMVEFWEIQRKLPYLLFAIAKLCFGVALLIGALVTVPQHIYDFSGWRMVSRILWIVGLPFWAVAVYSECWRVYKLWKAQGG
jgi:hypothetical protein